MALDITSLRALSTTQLRVLRNNYITQRRLLPRQHRSRGRSINAPTDTRRCNDAIRLINNVLRLRRVNKRPLGEFGS